jgi:hypothetical protein
MNKGLLILKWTVMFILFVMVFGWVTMSLWNWLVPGLFNGPVLTFWQALGLLLLSKILLGGFGGRHCSGRAGMHWKQRYYNKLSAMSPEDRERFKAKMREKWCYREKDTSQTNSNTSND